VLERSGAGVRIPTGKTNPGVSESASPLTPPQRQFFDYAGPLFSVVVSPAASTTPLNELRKFRALPRDRSRRRVMDDLRFNWEILEGGGTVAWHRRPGSRVSRSPWGPGRLRLSRSTSGKSNAPPRRL
jgi:hypothetical protein